jgi:hypothetical protein
LNSKKIKDIKSKGEKRLIYGGSNIIRSGLFRCPAIYLQTACHDQ